MKAKQLVGMSEADLQQKLKESKIELMKLNAQVATGTNPKSPGQVKQVKKTIARILTTLHMQTLAATQQGTKITKTTKKQNTKQAPAAKPVPKKRAAKQSTKEEGTKA